MIRQFSPSVQTAEWAVNMAFICSIARGLVRSDRITDFIIEPGNSTLEKTTIHEMQRRVKKIQKA